MVLSLFRIAFGAGVVFAIGSGTVPAYAAARELAIAEGTISISEARPGLRAPLCEELVVEARDAIDSHLIAETQPIIDEAGACRYALSVPAQTAVWLHVEALLVAGLRVINGSIVNGPVPGRVRQPSGSIALRFTIITPTTHFFAPNELKTIRLAY